MNLPKSFPQLLTMKQITASIPRSRASFYKDISAGLFPAPFKFSNSSYWYYDEIVAVMQARNANQSDEQIRALVKELMSLRNSRWKR